MNGEVRLGRAATVWAAATVATAVLVGWLTTVVTGPHAPGFGGWLVAGSGLVGALCLTWLWVLITAVVVDGVRGRTTPRAGVPGAVRRIVLAACGAALASGVASGLVAPAHADQGPAVGPGPRPAATAALLVGLPLPDRTTTTTRWLGMLGRQAATRPPATSGRQTEPHVVAPGDSLWEIARSTLPPRASDAEVERRWQEIYRANRDVVGADPDLIRPGQRLVMPDPREDGL